MKPALSVIFFTTLSGTGYGLLFFAGLFSALGLWPAERWLGFWALGLGLALVSTGLLASTFHLGHPERAWRALSQWRSSWLSREGVLALLTFLPAGILGIGWVCLESSSGFFVLMGLLTALLALVTVYCTSMIYASLKTVARWHDPKVPALYLLFSLSGGALWAQFFGLGFDVGPGWLGPLAALLLIGTWALKFFYWSAAAGRTGSSTIESATGLGALGSVSLFDPPHTEENYLLKEMGFRVARKHAQKLRRLTQGIGCYLPLALLVLSFYGLGGWSVAAALLAALGALIGTLLERWLFFAEATHKVTLYYGNKAA